MFTAGKSSVASGESEAAATLQCEHGTLARLTWATLLSVAGLRAAFSQPAFRLVVLVFAVPAPLLLTGDAMQRALLIASWMLVIVVEILNSAVETVMDRIGKDYHELSARAKDLGSAAVFCSILLAFGVWILILGDAAVTLAHSSFYSVSRVFIER